MTRCIFVQVQVKASLVQETLKFCHWMMQAKQKKLPKYDWPQALVYQTPGSHRVMTEESIKDKDGHEKLVTDIDNHTVFIRPKAIIGSSGSVWASEVVRLRHMKVVFSM